MTSLAKSLIAGSAIVTLMLSPAFADSSNSGSQILNGQVDLHTSTSTLNTTVDSTGGDVQIGSTAGGNALDVTTMNDTHVKNSQYTSSVDISSDLGARVTNVDGSVSVAGQAICNSAGISTDPNITQVNSYQECQAKDPSSQVYVDSWNVGGDFQVTNMAAGNTFEEDTNAPNAPITTRQLNASSVNANTTVHVQGVAGATAIQSTAIGNSAQIVHY